MIKKTILISFIALFVFFYAYSLSMPLTVTAQALPPINYDIVYVRSPRPSDNVNSFWPDAITPLLPDPGADLVLLHPDGSEEVLFAAGPAGAVVDPYVSYDGAAVVFAFYPNVLNVNPQRGLNSEKALSYDGADIYRINLQTRAVTWLTLSALGGSGNITVATEGRCAWQAVSNVSWLTVTSATSGIGSGAVAYSVAANPGPAGRRATITIGGKIFSVKQK